MSAQETEETYTVNTYVKWPLTVVTGEGVHVFDDKGNKYLDLWGGHAVCAIGHCHPKLVKAITVQAKKLIFYSNVAYNDVRAAAAEALAKAAYSPDSAVFFCNSGTEANETAIKIARRATGRPRIIATLSGFHGRTVGALSVTGNEQMLADFPQNLSSLTDYVPFGDFEAIEHALSPEVAAIVVEPIQSVGGVRVASRGYYDALREICSGNGTALIFDEVQTGFGRTGKMFAGMHWGVEPELTTFAKAAGGGFPVGGVILNPAIKGAPAPGEHGCTFGGGPIAMAALRATLEVIAEEELCANATAMEIAIRNELGAFEEVLAIRGKGLLLGIDLECEAKPVITALRERRILTGGSAQPNQIRLLPPLTLNEAHVREFAGALREALESVKQSA